MSPHIHLTELLVHVVKYICYNFMKIIVFFFLWIIHPTKTKLTEILLMQSRSLWKLYLKIFTVVLFHLGLEERFLNNFLGSTLISVLGSMILNFIIVLFIFNFAVQLSGCVISTVWFLCDFCLLRLIIFIEYSPWESSSDEACILCTHFLDLHIFVKWHFILHLQHVLWNARQLFLLGLIPQYLHDYMKFWVLIDFLLPVSTLNFFSLLVPNLSSSYYI